MVSIPRFGMTNTPDEELTRSPASQLVGQLALDSDLFLTHFEYRHHLTWPSYWVSDECSDLMKPLVWQRGILKEEQYSHFRHDQPLGSFNPNHVAKWTAHELCHGLVGFAWSPYMTTFAHSLSARLSELLPIALWYFFDEAQLPF